MGVFPVTGLAVVRSLVPFSSLPDRFVLMTSLVFGVSPNFYREISCVVFGVSLVLSPWRTHPEAHEHQAFAAPLGIQLDLLALAGSL